MKIVGYTDPWSVAPGETIRFMVSSEAPTYAASIVRLIHGDLNPVGPGLKVEPVATAIDGRYPGRVQGFDSGSYVEIPDAPALRPTGHFALRVSVFPTTPGGRPQGLLTMWEEARGSGYALVLDEQGAVAFWIGDGAGRIARVATGRSLRPFAWYLIEAECDPAAEMIRVASQPLSRWIDEEPAEAVAGTAGVTPAATIAPLLIAAWCAKGGDDPVPGGHFNGKIEAPSLTVEDRVVAAWDFTREISSARIVDAGPNGLDGRAVNLPMRGVTGSNFTGREVDWRLAPEEYGAIFFHDDDLGDAGWETAFALTIPDDFRSGVYAAQLRAGDDDDLVPFFVRPARGRATAPIAVLMPTYSYLAYGNEQITWRNPDSPVVHDPRDYLQAEDHYAVAHRLRSLYDHHADGTGCCYASRLRPLVNMRPDYQMALIRAPHQLGADLHLIDWLEASGFGYDVVTDEDLHHEGSALLAPYRAVVSGSHHEYWSAAMLDGLTAYLDGGGRFLSLCGNGYYWPIGVDRERPHVIEVRRGQNGVGTWRSAPGENHLSTTGELGGLWRDRGRDPRRLVGVGMAASGFDVALPYRRTPASYDPRAAFIFAGVADDALIGDAGLVMGGAAGLEVDRADAALGTPAHALVVATAGGFSDSYTRAIEEVTAADGKQGGTTCSEVRADMVFFETAHGGAVFAVGSIAWCGALSANGYDNPVARITGNVLSALAREGALPRS